MIALTRNGPAPSDRSPHTACEDDAKPHAARAGHDRGKPNRAMECAANSIARPLERGAVTALVILARQAYDRIKPVTDGLPDLDTWRREQSVLACGRRISEATKADFSAIKRHLLNLAGQAGQAFRSAMREGTEAERVALVKLEQSCAERGLKMDYPAAIARRQFKKSLQDCSAMQLWCLIFTVRNRRKAAPKAEGQRSRDYTLKPAAPPGDPF